MKFTLSATALAAGLVLGACAHNPQTPPPALVDARNTVHSAEMDPAVLSNAPLELKRATDALNNANTLYTKGKSLAEVESAAYVADRESQAAMAVAKSKRNDEAIKSAEVARANVRADVKDAAAQQAKSQAQAAEMRADAASSEATVAKANAADAQAQAALLAQQLADLQAKQTDRGMLVTLGDVLFEFNRAEIKPSAQGELRKLADFLQKHPDRRVLVEGYTDNVGSAAYNATLSQRRAESVATALSAMGVSPQRLASIGYGKDYPVADNTTNTNRALNRRVEVYISDNDQPVRRRG